MLVLLFYKLNTFNSQSISFKRNLAIVICDWIRNYSKTIAYFAIYLFNIKFYIEFNVARVANQSKWYEDLVSFLIKIAKGSPEDIFSDVWNLLSAELKILFLFKDLIVGNSKVKRQMLFTFYKSQKLRTRWGCQN